MHNCLRCALSTFAILLILCGNLSEPVSGFGYVLPDLVVSNVWIGDHHGRVITPAPRVDLYLWVAVSNVAMVPVSGYDEVVILDGTTLGRIPPAGKAIAWSAWYAHTTFWNWGPVRVSAGNHTLVWQVNPNRSINEADYTNNEMTMTFYSFDLLSDRYLSEFPPPFKFKRIRIIQAKGGFGLATDRLARHLVVGSWNDNLTLFSNNGALLWTKRTMGFGISSVAISANGNLVAVADQRSLYVFGLNGTLLWTRLDEKAPNSVSISGDGSRVAKSSHYAVTVYDGLGLPLWTKDHYDLHVNSLAGVSISNNGDYVALVGEMQFYPYDQGATVFLFSGSGSLLWSKLLGDHRLTATAVDDVGDVWVGDDWGYVHFFDKSGSLVWSKKIGLGPVSAFGFDKMIASEKSGQFVVVGSESASIIRIVSSSGETRAETSIDPPLWGISALAISSDGGYALAATWQGPVLMSLVNADDAMKAAQSMLSTASSIGANITVSQSLLGEANSFLTVEDLKQAYLRSKLSFDASIGAIDELFGSLVRVVNQSITTADKKISEARTVAISGDPASQLSKAETELATARSKLQDALTLRTKRQYSAAKSLLDESKSHAYEAAKYAELALAESKQFPVIGGTVQFNLALGGLVAGALLAAFVVLIMRKHRLKVKVKVKSRIQFMLLSITTSMQSLKISVRVCDP